MAKWRDLPPGAQITILRNFCTSTVDNFERWPTTFHKRRPFAKVMDNPYPRPLRDFTSALLTCREWYNAIMNDIKFAEDQSTSAILQQVQAELVCSYSDRVFEGSMGGDYREMASAQSMYGCFWRNPIVYETFEIFDDLFGGFDRTSRTILVGLLGHTLDKRKETRKPGEHIKAQRAMKNGLYCGLVFTSGQYYVGGDSMSCHTVSEWHLATFKNHDIKSGNHYSYGKDADEFKPVHEKWKGLPKISDAEPDTWWLVVDLSRDGWKNWFLVNYKKGELIVGPKGVECEWPPRIGIDLETLHLWQPEFLDEDFSECSDED